ncbi:MAG: hypothetical protein ACQETH_12585 [Candidatus Rifleibacteriota bacterium]
MRRLILTFILLIFICSLPQPAYTIHPLAMELFSNCLFDSDFGNPVDTYEDVDPITNIGPTVATTGPIIKHSVLNSFKNTVVRENVGRALIDKINSTNGRVLYDPGFLNFMKKFMDLEAEGEGEFGDWHYADVSKGFPADYDPGDDPHVMNCYLGLKPSPPPWFFVPKITLEPDGKSCVHNPDLCDYVNVCEEAVKDASGNVIVSAKHHQSTNNVYVNLGNYLYSQLLPGFSVDSDQSGIIFNMTFKDRTPPIIHGCVGGEFPEIGTPPNEATTGDWYKVDGLTISDNDSDFIGTCIYLGQIDGYPDDTSWMDAQEWFPQLPFNKVPNNGTTQNVIMPNVCYGIMQYTIFAWDENGLLNPGDPNIVENQPQICYGLQNPPSGYANLGRDPATAKPWPPSLWVASQTGSIEAIPPDQIDPDQKGGTGKIHVKDNDLPNLAIKIRSVKDGSTLFFPPVVEPLDLPIYSCSDYKKSSGLTEPNAKDYENFVGNPTKAVFTSQLVSKTKSLYFKILEAYPSPVTTSAEQSFLDRFKNPSSESDRDFIREHFRLEDYKESDTDLNGDEILSDETTFGRRNGFGGEVVAVLQTPLQEDVEYLISVWMDDNVKWATKSPTGGILGEIHPIPTGIDDGEINIKVPNQVPAFSYQRPIDKNAAISEEIKVVFREPTIDNLGSPPTGGDNISYFHNGKFPFIEVWVKDYSGLQRKIKLYLRVHNENPDIRIIESEHGKSG